MQKKLKLNLILIVLGVSASIIGFIGFVQNNDTLLPIATVIFILSAIIYVITLFIEKKNNEL